MAKSFKKTALAAQAPKRTSEKDFLDFLEQERTAPQVLPAPPASKPTQGNTGNTSNTRSRRPTGNTSNTSSTSNTASQEPATLDLPSDAAKPVEQEQATPAAAGPVHTADVRQTFIIGQQYLEQLKDYVHTRRVAGQYEYTQKQALHAALDLLFAKATIEPRPAHIREQEETRKQRIRRGMPK